MNRRRACFSFGTRGARAWGRPHLPLKLASFAALVGALSSLAFDSIRAWRVGVRANPTGAPAFSSGAIASRAEEAFVSPRRHEAREEGSGRRAGRARARTRPTTRGGAWAWATGRDARAALRAGGRRRHVRARRSMPRAEGNRANEEKKRRACGESRSVANGNGPRSVSRDRITYARIVMNFLSQASMRRPKKRPSDVDDETRKRAPSRWPRAPRLFVARRVIITPLHVSRRFESARPRGTTQSH